MQQQYEKGLLQNLQNVSQIQFSNNRLSKLQAKDQENPECYEE